MIEIQCLNQFQFAFSSDIELGDVESDEKKTNLESGPKAASSKLIEKNENGAKDSKSLKVFFLSILVGPKKEIVSTQEGYSSFFNCLLVSIFVNFLGNDCTRHYKLCML